ncbi:MAG: GbsR/MarR family transcriptional regulator [Desulfotomaculum sp.]|nr:GbsR/MarR family transcriptional regulator [Desulfotomaculum sp.]
MQKNNVNSEEYKKLNEARDLIINAMAETMDFYGVTPSTGRLYGTMFFLEKPMTLDEMAKAMGMSKTSMSNTARTLLEKKVVEKVWQKGVRKDLYQAEQDFFKTFAEFFCHGWRREMEVNLKAINKAEPIIKELAESDDEQVREAAQKDLKKLENAKKYYLWLEQLVEAVETGKIYEFIPKPEESE